MDSLPVSECLPDLTAALAEGGRAVLIAPPGAGKTTLVPPVLLQAPWRRGRTILMLEPRRVAARAAARRIAGLLGEPLGETVGLTTRTEKAVGPKTVIEVVTEGILTRRLLDDPELTGVAAILFDEFHERSLQADLGLALSLEVADALRDDLRLLVMSATLDPEPVARLLGGAPVIRSEGHTFPVDLRFRDEDPVAKTLVPRVAAAAEDVMAAETGSALAFLPGEREIRGVVEALDGRLPGVDVLPLFGALSPAEQDAAIRPASPGSRKLVVATDIAETSLTIDGVRIVIDGGFRRSPRFDAGSGMTRLVTTRISRAAADQRTGRAGRTEPGVALRLWPKAAEGAMAAFDPPEILDADLAPLLLETLRWGAVEATDLPWLDPPPAASLTQAQDLLRMLGALDGRSRLLRLGEKMARLPVHPRLAALLLRSVSAGEGALGAGIAALLEARDPMGGRNAPVDPTPRLERLAGGGGPYKQIAQDAKRLMGLCGAKGGLPKSVEPGSVGRLLAHAYPDRIARHRGADGRYLLTGGRGATLDREDRLFGTEWLVAATLVGTGPEPRMALAAPIDPDDLPTEGRISEDRLFWDREREEVKAERVTRLGAVVLQRHRQTSPDPEAVAGFLAEHLARDNLNRLPWSGELERLRDRLAFLHRLEPDRFPAMDDATLKETLVEWIGPYLAGLKRRAEVTDTVLIEALLGRLDWEDRQALDRLAPERVTVPSGNRHRLDYPAEGPVLAVKLQELFGMRESPMVADGRVPVTVHLLSPAGRPLQVTQDLAGFWASSYHEVAKEMRGRYPKHPWPEDPVNAVATARLKGRR